MQEHQTAPLLLIERRSVDSKPLDTVSICSCLELVDEAIDIYLEEGLEPEDDHGDWHFAVLRVNVDDFSPLGMRLVQRRDRDNQIIEVQ